jgi:hypothetical protein
LKHKLAASEKWKHEVAKSTVFGIPHSPYRGIIKVTSWNRQFVQVIEQFSPISFYGYDFDPEIIRGEFQRGFKDVISAAGPCTPNASAI